MENSGVVVDVPVVVVDDVVWRAEVDAGVVADVEVVPTDEVVAVVVGGEVAEVDAV